MRVNLNGQSFEVPQDFVHQLAGSLWEVMERMYEEKIDDKAKIGLMVVTRGMLLKEELAVRITHGKEAARAMRPPPKADPNLWLGKMLLPHVEEVINGASLTCETSGDTVTAFQFTIRLGDAGGQVDTTRIERVRENYGA